MKLINLHNKINHFCLNGISNGNTYNFINRHRSFRNSLVLILMIICPTVMFCGFFPRLFFHVNKGWMSLLTFIFFLEIPLLLRMMSQEGNKYAITVKKYSVYISMGLLAMDTYLLLPKYYIKLPSYFESFGIVVVFLYIVYSFIGIKDINQEVIKNNINNPKVPIRLNKLNILLKYKNGNNYKRRSIMSEKPSKHITNVNNNIINSLLDKESYRWCGNSLKSADLILARSLASSTASTVSSVAVNLEPSSSTKSSSDISDSKESNGANGSKDASSSYDQNNTQEERNQNSTNINNEITVLNKINKKLICIVFVLIFILIVMIITLIIGL